MFSTARVTPVDSAIPRTASTKRAENDLCQTNGGWTTTVVAPSSRASSAERLTLSTWSRPKAKCATGSTGACTESTGRPQRAVVAWSRSARRVVRSAVTITSTPSKPVSRARRKASSVDRGKTQDVLIPTVITPPGYDRRAAATPWGS
ncbi:hypothetical protein EDF50_0949 [Frigoribacterium sp. PhB24]|nr:hypothetical protein EDF50_0949 [Frigoribacterium sp. PhB24]